MAWSNGIPVSPQLFILFTTTVALACFLAMPLIYLLLGSEDADMRRQQTYNAEDFDSWQMLSLKRRFIVPVLSILFFVGLFWIGMRHY